MTVLYHGRTGRSRTRHLGNDSWKRGGGSIWTTGSYDPETNLTSWGAGNAGPDRLAGVRTGPQTAEGVFARVIDDRTLYVNTTSQEQKIPISGRKVGIVTHRVYDETVVLPPQQADLVQ